MLPNDRAQRLGSVTCHIAGHGPPLLLVHSVNAAASAHELRPLFERWQQTHTVYAPDLPGFGESRRDDVAYSPRLYTDSLHAVVDKLRQWHGAAPLPALALSLGCEFLARAASERPDMFSRLVLVSPTGLNGTAARRGPPGGTRAVPGLHRILSVPLWGPLLFRALTRPAVVRYFLERTWGSKTIDERMWQDAVATARAPGAHHAPLHFLGGGLFSGDIGAVYESLTMPVWACHGTRGDFTDYRGKAALQGRPNWHFTVFDNTGALPYFEQPEAFTTELRGFLAAP
jgi:pimeloyl-ACP methyl ester carboxylesterase